MLCNSVAVEASSSTYSGLEDLVLQGVPALDLRIIGSYYFITGTTFDERGLCEGGSFALHLLIVCCIVCLCFMLETVEVFFKLFRRSSRAIEPGVRLDLLHGEAFAGVWSSQTDNQVKEIRGGIDLAHIHGLDWILVHTSIVDIIRFTEREFTIAHDEEHDANGEAVNRRAFVLLITSSEELGSHVVRSAEFSLESFSLRTIEDLLHPKVSNFEGHIFVQETVLQLEISVRDLLFVDVRDRRH